VRGLRSSLARARHALPLCALLACQSSPRKDDVRPAPPSESKLRTLPAPPAEPVQAQVLREAAREHAQGRRLLIYVGASWCEPCQRFHDAAASGQLDATFPKLTLLEFDRDRDEARLTEAGCITRYIPLFAVPDATGRCSPRHIEGSIKGEGAVAEITPRLAGLLQ
jgi:thiol-disulfide isomerase/thioredoxin